MKCEKCGAALPEEARFCDQCGTPVPSQPAAVHSEQNVDTLRGQAVGVIDNSGSERPGGISTRQRFGTIEEGGSAVGAVLGGEGGDIHVGGRQNYDRREVRTEGGAYVEGSVQTGGGDFAGRDMNKVGTVSNSTFAVGSGSQATSSQGVSGQDLATLFGSVYRLIESRPEKPDVDKDELQEMVRRIEAEAGKGEEGNPDKVRRRLKALADVAPDVLKVTAATLTNPVVGVASAIASVAERVLHEAGLTSD